MFCFLFFIFLQFMRYGVFRILIFCLFCLYIMGRRSQTQFLKRHVRKNESFTKKRTGSFSIFRYWIKVV